MAATIQDVIAQMVAAGLTPPKELHVGAGRITRFGKNRNSWYILYEHQLRNGKYVIVGTFGDWAKQVTEKVDVDWRGLDERDREALRRQMEVREIQEREKRERKARMAANRARGQWRSAYTVEQAAEKKVTSPYLIRKLITPEACRLLEDGTVLIPAYVPGEDGGASLVGLQKIAGDGEKRFNAGMAKAGAAAMLGKRPADGEPLILVEGYATGRSIRMATKEQWPVFLAFDAGNLLPVARALRERYPKSPVVFCADDDWKVTLPDQTPFNPGLVKAREAARAIGNAYILVPLFKAEGRGDKETDFNDLHVREGIDIVAQQIDVNALLSSTPINSKPQSDAPHDEDDSGREPGFDGSGYSSNEPPPRGDWWSNDWITRPWIQKTDKGVHKPTLHNFEQYISLHKAWAEVLAFDEFAELPVKMKGAPWQPVATPVGLQEWTALDHNHLAKWLSTRGMEAKDTTLVKAIDIVAHYRPFNGPKEYLLGLKHDGNKRLITWLIDYIGACTGKEFGSWPQEEQDRIRQYCELVGQKWMVGAVARVLKMGCKMDNMLILEGDQGRMKSTVFRVLGGEWFTDAQLELEGSGLKDSQMILQGHWIIEIPEIESLNKASTGAIKRFIAQDTDLFRPPYGAMLKKAKRRCVFGGTVNHDVYLKDDSGNRRFWPVKCWRDVDLERLEADRDQLWAEAVALYQSGFKHWVSTSHERMLFHEEQDKRYLSDEWENDIARYVANRERVTMGAILLDCLLIEKGRWDRPAQTRVGSIMRRLGWQKLRQTSGGSRENYYVAPEREPGKKVNDDQAL